MKKRWFTGSGYIESDFQNLKKTIRDHGKFYEGVISEMPGISRVELLAQGDDHLTIKTNEGLMKRTNIRKQFNPEVISIAFDEEYSAGKTITVCSHFVDEFTASGSGVNHQTTISHVNAPGFLGFFYRLFASNNIGRAVLSSHKKYLENLRT